VPVNEFVKELAPKTMTAVPTAIEEVIVRDTGPNWGRIIAEEEGVTATIGVRVPVFVAITLTF
jgi:hypothetical protein